MSKIANLWFREAFLFPAGLWITFLWMLTGVFITDKAFFIGLMIISLITVILSPSVIRNKYNSSNKNEKN